MGEVYLLRDSTIFSVPAKVLNPENKELSYITKYKYHFGFLGARQCFRPSYPDLVDNGWVEY